jgi:hypothetical protein
LEAAAAARERRAKSKEDAEEDVLGHAKVKGLLATRN